MKKVYWRPHRVSRVELVLIAMLSLAGLVAVQVFPVVKRQPYFKEKRAAARLAQRALETVKEERLKRRIPISEEGDPMQSGLIGDLISPIVSNTGHLPAKQTSINPNFAAMIVHYLREADVEPGDTVAVGLSGSFPAINVAVYAALETLKLRPVIISSTSASQWGATHPDFTWLDMERVLHARRIFSFRSVAASRGGIEDRALGLTKVGKQMLDEAIRRNGLTSLAPKSYEESVLLRMAAYTDEAGDAPIRAYINVGGGTASVGTKVGKRLFRPGLNRHLPGGSAEEQIDSVMLRFAYQGVPVLHLVRVATLADRWGLPLQPSVMPPVGQDKIFVTVQYNPWLAAAVLVVLLAALVGFVRLHLGTRLSGMLQRPSTTRPQPTQMV